MNENSITEFEVVISKLNKKLIKSRTVCTTSSDFLYPEINNNVRLFCSVDEVVLDNEIVKINVDNNGYSKYIQFDYFDDKNNRISKNILINYKNENWESGETLYDYDDTNENDYESGTNNSKNGSMFIFNKLIYLLIIFWLNPFSL